MATFVANLSRSTASWNRPAATKPTRKPGASDFENDPQASSTVGQVQIVTKLDDSLDPQRFQLGDMQIGDIQVRVVEYGVGYVADHWCHKGHILFVLTGTLTIEHDDGGSYDVAAGESWHAGDDQGAPHRVVCPDGATVFIVD